MTKMLKIDGLPVVDARRAVSLTVARRDIVHADKKEPGNCAVARACRRELHAKEVRVHLGRVYIRTDEKRWTRYLTPKMMRSEIIAFDRGGTFEPSTFRLTPPYPTKQLGKRRGTDDPFDAASKRTRSGKKRRAPHVVTNVRVGAGA